MLKHRADVRSLAFVTVALLLLGLPHAWLPTPGLAVPWIACASLACFIASIINHNHMHQPVFTDRRWNICFNLALSLARGHSAGGVIVPHNLNHHVQAGAEDDWISPRLAGQGLGWWRLLRYVVVASGNMMIQRQRADAPRLPKSMRASLILEKLVLAIVVALACLHDWQIFLAYNVVPWLLGLALLVGVNLLQHDGCDPGSVLGESRNFTGKWGNWMFFNNGFHSAHHYQPALHWSQLPALHATLAQRLPGNDLTHASIVVYLWHFGWSRVGVH